MGHAYEAGGWGMYPTTIIGILLVVGAVYYAVRPERRNLAIVACLALMTFISGLLGFVTGVINTMRHATDGSFPEMTPETTTIAGIGESLNNVGLALVLLMIGAILVFAGVLRGRGQSATERATAPSRA